MHFEPARVRYQREPVQIGFNRRLPKDGRCGDGSQPSRRGAAVGRRASNRGFPLQPDRRAAEPRGTPGDRACRKHVDYGRLPRLCRGRVRKSRGESGVFMFAQGCGGNINGSPLQGGVDAAAAAGGKLAAAVARTLDAEGNLIDGKPLRVFTRQLALPLGPPPPVAECERMLAGETDAGRKEQFADLLDIARSGQPRTMEFRIRAFALGDQLCILGLSHEVFAEYHQFVNEVSPFAYNMVFAYTNGVESYVATEKDYLLGSQGGYESAAIESRAGLQIPAAARPGSRTVDQGRYCPGFAGRENGKSICRSAAGPIET